MRTVNVIEGIFFAALEKAAPGERAAYLDQACGDDAELRRCVERMLAAQPNLGNFLQPPAAGSPATTDAAPPLVERPGTVIGPYKLLQQLGEGGFGVVFLAEQTEPVRRKVALKVIKPGLDSKQVVARFEAERQALALMDHPNIARVLDGGTTPSPLPLSPSEGERGRGEGGRPFFVMELVNGVPITEFCDQNHLTPRERLELFIPVCQAVQHAHQKGVIHRDLKPSNVLVTLYDDKAVPKVIDFGVAKATEQRLTEKTLFTQHGALVGTFEYMSPEQAELNALGVDTRSDIYALGVLLYELLTSTTPLERERVRQAGLQELVRLIKEEDPPQPSVRLSSCDTLAKIAAARGTEPARLPQLVKGEIDWIVMKCLEKDRTRRYDTASALARDIERYLGDEPIEAGPPSAGYRLRKFVKRNRGAVTAAAVVLSAVLLGIVGTTWGWVEALWQRDDAVQAREKEAEQRKVAVKAIGEARDAAAGRAKAETARAEEATRKIRLVEAHRALERGMNACERDQVQEGLLWLARSLEAAPEDDLELQLSLRRLLAAWSREISTLKEIIPLQGTPMAISPNRNVIVEAYNDGIDGSVWLTDVHTGKWLSEPLRMSGLVYQIVFSPDGKLMATASLALSKKGRRVWQVGIRLWEVGSRKPVGKLISWEFTSEVDPVNRFNRHPSWRFQTAFTADNSRLLSVLGGYARLWEAPSGKPVGEPIRACGAVFSPDSKELLTVEGNHKTGVDFWDVRTGKPAPRRAEGAVITSLAISPDGKLAACGGFVKASAIPNYVSVIETTTGRTVAFGSPSSVVLEVAFAPTGNLIVVESNEGVELFPIPSGLLPIDSPVPFKRTGSLIPEPGGCLWPDVFAFSPDGQKLLTMSSAGQVRLWDAANAAPIGAPGKLVPFHQRLWAAFDQTGAAMLTPDYQNIRSRLLRWQLPPSPVIRKLDSQPGVPMHRMHFSPDGATIAVPWEENDQRKPHAIRFLDRRTGKISGEPILLPDRRRPTLALGFSPDGKILMALTVDPNGMSYSVLLWNTATRQPIGRPIAVAAVAFSMAGFDAFAYPFAFTRDSKRLVVGDGDGAQILITSTGTAVGKRLEIGVKSNLLTAVEVSALAFSPDGKLIIGGCPEGTVKVWNAETGEEAGPSLPKRGSNVNFVAFSSDGTKLLTCALEKRSPDYQAIRVWDARTGRSIGEAFLNQDPVSAPCISTDCKTLLTRAPGYTTARLWDIDTGKPRSRNHLARNMWSLALSPDGKLLATENGGLELWDVATGRPLGKPRPTIWLEPFFSTDSRSLVYFDRSRGADSQPRLLEITQPVQGDPARLRLWVEVITGRELDAGGEVAELDTKAWQERYDRLQKLGGPPTP
jgi:serine/threonine protein kinase/WD40 repeat protein